MSMRSRHTCGGVLLMLAALLATALRYEVLPAGWLSVGLSLAFVVGGVIMLTDRRPPRRDPWGGDTEGPVA